MLKLTPPEALTPEAWLSKWDKGTLLPDWPTVAAKAIVVVREQGRSSEAYVLLSPAELTQSCLHEARALYFQVLKSKLLTPGVCPGLTATSFQA